MNGEPVAATATIREVYALVGQSKAELSQEIQATKSELSQKVQDTKNELLEELKGHELAHIKNDQARKSRMRFAITASLAFGTLGGGFLQWFLTQLLK